MSSVKSVFPNAKPKKVGRALIVRFKKPRASLHVYDSGKVLCLGALSIKSAERAIRKFVNLLRSHGIYVKRPRRVEVRNIIAIANLHGEIDLQRATWALSPGAIYEPDQFPGLIYRPGSSHGALRILMFNSGKVVVSGARSEEEAREAIYELADELKNRGLLLDEEFCAVDIWLPREQLRALQELVRNRVYLSIDEAICQAVRDLLAKHGR